MLLQTETRRLKLRRWTIADLEDFARLHNDQSVMRDLGGPITKRESEIKLADYMKDWDENGYGRWCLEDLHGHFLGYAGVKAEWGEHPLGVHNEIGWRLHREAWGNGYAVEAARAALRDVFLRSQLTEVLAYTAPDNLQSQSVLRKLPFERVTSLDFSVPWEPIGTWHGLVWRTNPDLALEHL